MRILYVLSETPLNRHAGISTYLGHAIKAQLLAGNEVHLLTWRFKEDDQLAFPHSMPLDDAHIKVLEIEAATVWKTYGGGNWTTNFSHFISPLIADSIRTLRPDVVETSDFDAPMTGYLMARQAGFYPDIADIPVICYNHGLVRPIYAADFTPISDDARLQAAAERNSIRLADLVLVPSEAAGEFLRQECGELPNAVMLPEPYVITDAKSHVPRDRYIHLGRLAMSKGLDFSIHFLNVANSIAPIEEVEFVGKPGYIQFRITGPGEYIAKKLAPAVFEKTKVTKGVPYEEVASKLSGGGYSLNFSRQETFNYAFLESLEAGLLPYARKGTAMAEFFPPSLENLVLPETFDLRSLRDSVEQYRSNGSSLHAELSKYAFERTDPRRFASTYARFVAEARSKRIDPPRRDPLLTGTDVTVLVPTFNPRNSLSDAVASALNQTTPVLEVVVLDDGSFEKSSLDLLATLSGMDRVRVIRSAANEGLSATRVKLIDQVTTEAAVFLDDDDQLDERFVELSLMGLNRSVDVDAAIPWRQNFDQNRQIITNWHFDDYEQLLSNDLRMTAVITTAALRSVGFTPSMRNGEADDWDFWLRFRADGRSAIPIPSPLFRYRFYQGSMSWPWSAGQMVGTSHAVSDGILKLWRNGDVPAAFVREVVTAFFARGAKIEEATDQLKSAKPWLIKPTKETYKADMRRATQIARLRERVPLIGVPLYVVFRAIAVAARISQSRFSK